MKNKKLPTLAEIQVRYSHQITQENRMQVTRVEESFKMCMHVWDADLIAYQEAFLVFFLNRANCVLGYRWISTGGTSATVVDAKHIFGIAVTCNASGILLAHNHPSNNTQPSQADLDLTKKIKKGAKLLDITVLDHLIVTPDQKYFSFTEEGLL